jgi:Fe-S oxidoreductase
MGNVKLWPKDDYWRKYYWDLRKVAWNCARCSTCKWIDPWELKDARFAKVCPSSSYYLFDAFSCQGRMDASLALLDGDLKVDDEPEILDLFYKCNTCGGCDAMCKRVQDMEPLRVMLEMRAKFVQDGQVLPQFVPIIEGLRKEDNMMMGKKADRARWMEGLNLKNPARDKCEVLLHVGCRSSYDDELFRLPRAIVEVFNKAGVDFGVLGKDESCCGGRAYSIGYRGEFTKFAESNIQAWTNAGVKTVVTACSDGYYAMSRLYPSVGIKYNFEVLHIVEYLDRLLKQGKLKFTRKVPMTVTWHDPCHLGRRLAQAPGYYVPGQPIMGLYEEPRNILKAIPGLNLVEMLRIKEYAWCCGGGGGVIDAYPEFNSFTAGERIKEARETGAEALVTACPWCNRSLTDGAKSIGERMPVMDIIELVKQAI